MIQPLKKYLAGKRIILASGSPRRKQIIEDIGLNVEIIPSTFEENLLPSDFSTLSDFAMETAKMKAIEVCSRVKTQSSKDDEDILVIGADTIVVLDNELFGKPGNPTKAYETLYRLSGKTHSVCTGVCLLWKYQFNEQIDTFYEMTQVKMSNLPQMVVQEYIKTGEPLDKAGGYGIQGLGGTLIEKIEGDYYNVVGFPVNKFCRELYRHFAI